MEYIKYPRTPHLPWSPGNTADDELLENVEHFNNSKVVVTEKMDGENTTLYSDHCHARSVDSVDHLSRHWMKRFHSQIKHDIPQNFRICGENVYAKHSIFYDRLPSYFLTFGIYAGNKCLSWPETLEWCAMIGLNTVPVLYVGEWNEAAIKKLYTEKSEYGAEQEGYVVRTFNAFDVVDFDRSVAKYVRAGHVNTNKHWMFGKVTPNVCIPLS